MQRDHTYHIWPRDLDFPAAFRKIEAFAEKREMVWHENKYHNYHLSFNSYESAYPDSFDEFLGVLSQAKQFESFECCLPFLAGKSNGGMTFYLTYRSTHIHIGINGPNDDVVVAAHSFIRSEWQLSNPPLPVGEIGRPRNLQATIFLGKHFDAESEKPSLLLRQFLELLRFDVIEADEYRATTIPEKVKKQIEKQDIYVGLVTGKRGHDWITAEAAFAHGKNRHVILAIEDGSGFNPTIHGRDYEHIPFPVSLIEKSFIPLMQEFRSLGISGIW